MFKKKMTPLGYDAHVYGQNKSMIKFNVNKAYAVYLKIHTCAKTHTICKV